MSVGTEGSVLRRLDDTTWSYLPHHGHPVPKDEFSEIRMRVPPYENGKDRYKLATAVAYLFERNQPLMKQEILRRGINANLDHLGPELSGTWRICFHRINCLSKRVLNRGVRKIKQYIPFTRQFRMPQIASVDVIPVKDSVMARVAAAASRVQPLRLGNDLPGEVHLFSSDPLPEALDPYGRASLQSFQDSFTRLATKAFETIERDFVMEAEHRGSLRFVINDTKSLSLVEDRIPEDEEAYRNQNRDIVRQYKQFLIDEFGQPFVDQMEVSCRIGRSKIQSDEDIGFDKMIEEGLPLYPDHVSKCNIYANNIEFRHLEDLWDGLQKLNSLLKNPRINANESAAEFLRHPLHTFSFREIRGILRLTRPRGEVQDLAEFLRGLIGDSSGKPVSSLPVDSFNKLVSILMPTDEERNLSFTGRKILHRCIMGFHTMGDKNIPNPCRDLFELLHVFDDCRKASNWDNYFEILSHVVAKKALYRANPHSHHPDRALHVGLLIPAPDTNEGEHRILYNKSVFDDSQGDLNYVFLPACDNYRDEDGFMLPMIKLYRSTASNRNALNWHDSVAADLNPFSSPGSMNPELSFPDELPQFEERTIPTWVAHLIGALHRKRWLEATNPNTPVEQVEAFKAEFRDRMLEAARSCIGYLKHQKKDEAAAAHLESLRQNVDLDGIEATLSRYRHEFREDPRYKIPQDIAFVGHSLGGALAQAGVFFFTANIRRIPLPGHRVICYSSDGPGINGEYDSQFMKFGRNHRSLFAALHIQWNIHHKFEHGDIVPQAGRCSLATTNYYEKKDQDWLSESIEVFTPREEAKALSILDPPTHGRRIGTAQEGRDYFITYLSPKDLYDYHHGSLWRGHFWLRGKAKQVWGYRFLNSPQITDLGRRAIGMATYIPLWAINKYQGEGNGPRNEQGVLALHYSRNILSPAPSPDDELTLAGFFE